jgi:transcriptional regulator with XRE-family HTH domain
MCADRAGISVRSLKRIESYRASPTLTTVQKLTTALRCSWEDLLGPANCAQSAARSKS